MKAPAGLVASLLGAAVALVTIVIGASAIGADPGLPTNPNLPSHAVEYGYDALGDYLGRWGELLPLECGDTELFVFNASRSLSALDEERSDVMRFGEGRIMKINRHAFDAAVIADVEIFKLTEMPWGSVYLTGDAVEIVEQSGLAGTDFELVWSDDCWPIGRRVVS